MIIPCQAGRMADGGFCSLATSAALQYDYWLVTAPAKVHEPSAISERFKVKPNATGIRVFQKIGKDIAFIDIHFVADGADLAETGYAIAQNIDDKTSGD